ncbi:cation diffusion facilitator family transporter [Pelovirga terrestris]|uniref:Cation transporter n=1 Tax=Pelovirga terrestris TaxID=2771352 RepID=A0A8J6QL72_9BACT|nr:cation diffusion facilitator family transporter [Pelovirga terrestris]MBD1399082.1 cation transporter [Pelovirga terrestris]
MMAIDSEIPDQQAQAARKVTLIGLVVNTLNALIKVVVGFWANSYALIADGIHSASDMLSDVLVLVASHYGRQRPDKDHPYGHDRYETLATLILGALLIAVAGALVWDSLMRLLTPRELVTPGAVALVVALASIASKEWIYRYTLRIARQINSRLLEGNAWHHRTDSLSSIVVFVAIGGALLGVTWLDQLAAVVVALMVARIGFTLIWDSLKELVDTALPQDVVANIRASALTVPGVRDVHDLRSRRMANRTLLDIHLQVDPHISVSEGHEVGAWVARLLRNQYDHISDVIFHIDPECDEQVDVTEDSRRLPLRPDAVAQLTHCWQGVPLFDQPHHTVLHYLDLAIDVDLFYRSADVPADHIEPLQATLMSRAADLSWLRKVSVWIGEPPDSDQPLPS